MRGLRAVLAVVTGVAATTLVLAGCGGSGTVTVGSGGVVVSGPQGVASVGPSGVGVSGSGGAASIGPSGVSVSGSGGNAVSTELPAGWPAAVGFPDGFDLRVGAATGGNLTASGTVPDYAAAVSYYEANLSGDYAVSETVKTDAVTTMRLANGGTVIVRSVPSPGVEITLPAS